ncbi:SHOCT-like domain-containing protein [Fredinandcohnia sp. 179-A 10B2 NHS]|uniref:SHOCT-like domain-containing protein n=1 Tax=Fredinandcohnia sp. 179-A 10B2 NHS TaxID=3235176 RepID=UPI0039A24446
MSDEISRVLTMLEEGKLNKEKAAELIDVLQGKGNQDLNKQTSTTYLNKMLKIRVASEDGDNVNINLPIKLLKAVLKVGTNVAKMIPESEKYVKDIDVELLIEAIENEMDGQIVDVTSSNGDKVLIVIE